MEKTTTYVALDDSKRKLVAGILRPGATDPEQRELPKEPHLIRRLFARLRREGPVEMRVIPLLDGVAIAHVDGIRQV
jgi:hypothetical protein